MERPAGVRHRRCPQDQGGRGVAGRKPADGVGAGRCRRAGRPAGDDRRARRRRRAGRAGPARGTPRRANRPQGGAGRRGRGTGANSTQWKAAGDRLREILEEWRTISGLDRKTDDALWKRYSAARETFNRRRGSHFAELDRERVGARQAKEALCERAEELAGSTDWGATGAAFRDLLTQWKAAGRAAKDVDDALWQRFKAAQDTFFTARNAASAERDAEFRANADGEGGAAGRGREARHVRPRRRPRRAARHRREVGRDRQGPPRAQRRAGAAAAGGGEEGARRGRRAGSIRRPRPAPTNSVLAQSNSSGRRRRPRRPAGPRMPRRRGPTPSSGGSGRRRRPRRSARGAEVAFLPVSPARRSVSSSSSRLSSRPFFCRSAATRRRSSSAASCSAVRAHTALAQL